MMIWDCRGEIKRKTMYIFYARGKESIHTRVAEVNKAHSHWIYSISHGSARALKTRFFSRHGDCLQNSLLIKT